MDDHFATPAVPPLASAEVEARIDTERNRLLDEQRIEADLLQQRIAPLEAGDDESLDRIETQINQARDRQLRIQERIELLQTRLEAAKAVEREAHLDHLQRLAEAARERAVKIIFEDYARLAPELADSLRRIEVADTLVERVNMVLRENSRAPIRASNWARCRPERRYTETVRKRFGPSERGHPHYGNIAGGSEGDLATAVVYLKGGGEAPALAEVDVQEERTISEDRPEVLFTEVLLPGVGPAPEGKGLAPIWKHDPWNRKNVSKADLDALAAEIEASFEPDLEPDEPASAESVHETGIFASVSRTAARALGKVVGGGES
jgi:hypothetical protein